MTVLGRRVAACALALALALSSASASAQAAEPVFERYSASTVGGAEINIEVMRPAGVQDAPVVLTYSPYNTLSEYTSPNLANDELGQRLLPKGYARAVADVLGTRNSSGCWDYGGADEQQSGVDVVNFLTARPWSNGKVAMIGGSYDGTTANMVAARGRDVPGLAAIVPQSAISRWYGYAYSGGVRYFLNSEQPTDEGIDTPLAFDFGLARTPPTRPEDPLFAQKLASRANPCESVQHTLQGYSDTPDYDDFWRERDYLRDLAHFRGAALVVHGWQDYNVKPNEGIDFYARIRGLRRLYMFQGSHESPNGREGFDALLERFFDHTLRGIDNGVDREPPVISEGRAAGGSAGFGSEASWPPTDARRTALWLDRGGLRSNPGPPATESYRDFSVGSEERARQDPVAESDWLFFQTDPLQRDTRLAGTPEFRARVKVDQASADLTPVLVDVAPDGSVATVSRGFLDLRYRDGLEQAKPVPANAPVDATVRFQPQDQTFPAGHRIGLLVMSSNSVWAVPGAPGTSVELVQGGQAGSRLMLPLVGR